MNEAQCVNCGKPKSDHIASLRVSGTSWCSSSQWSTKFEPKKEIPYRTSSEAYGL